jgi:hypothetical protein
MTSSAGCWWLTPLILPTEEAEIRRIAVRSQTRQIVGETLSRKTLHTKKKKKNRAGGMAQDEGPEFKPHFRKKKKQMTSSACDPKVSSQLCL